MGAVATALPRQGVKPLVGRYDLGMTGSSSTASSAPFPANYKFVELARTFRELSKDARETDHFDLTKAFFVGAKIGWAELLRGHRTVILSEAGSGKTEEIREAAVRLRSDGKQPFFLRLEHIPTDFDDAFEVGTFEEFQSWLHSNDEGWLLLD